MKKFLVAVILLCLFIQSYGQKKSEDFDRMYFLIGTLSDYMSDEKSDNF
ncbi:hypothetical protein [Autumnicola psychrophila]|uniref:Uncharacterized protein n=1 Tax=Autumnicola psychrophila TaxID=3075592 RepID=A0ABU3DTD3_9FLAO|nr:hypothetical protein [Zunongwangia sp. F225]MDT0686950.1 hypothetical protein [Zunongwangia sp. F225]